MSDYSFELLVLRRQFLEYDNKVLQSFYAYSETEVVTGLGTLVHEELRESCY